MSQQDGGAGGVHGNVVEPRVGNKFPIHSICYYFPIPTDITNYYFFSFNCFQRKDSRHCSTLPFQSPTKPAPPPSSLPFLMASFELENPSSHSDTVTVTVTEEMKKQREVEDLNETEIIKKKKKKKKKKSSYLSKIRFGCFRVESDKKGNFDMEVTVVNDRNPSHLLVMVNGLIGSADDWKFTAKQFLKTYPQDIIVHCSECNYSNLTFHGVDVMGRRLAKEVMSVIKQHPYVQKISFIGHSLGGLIARYAIGELYEEDVSKEGININGECNNQPEDQSKEEKCKGKIAGLEPVNFITSATPHLGSRGHKQVPAFCGFYPLEKVATRTSSILGRTGKHLFLMDKDNGKRPLLLQMASDSKDLKFLSALRSFRRRVTYANVRYDNIVGWSTSSIRHHNELPKLKHLSRDRKYPHIINVETAKIPAPQLEVPTEAKANGYRIVDLEEEMIKGLTSVGWDRVDVDFHRSKQRYFAHNTILVRNSFVNSDGACVIQHMVDNFLL